MPRILLACLLAIATCCPVWTAESAPAQPATVDEATRIAAEIIQQRARDSETAGHPALATQLNALAKGLVSGKVTLYDASLVMQIAVVDAPAKSAGTAA